MRYLAIDLGGRRTGLAVGDDRTRTVSPAGVIEQPPGEHLIHAVEKAVRDYQPGALVIGLPLNMDESEGESAKQARELGKQIAAATKLPVHYQDERLTSFAADARMARSGRTHKQKKQIRDAIAAVEILRDFLDEAAES